MTAPALNVLIVVGTLGRQSSTRTVLREAAAQLRPRGCTVDWLDLLDETLPPFNPDSSRDAAAFAQFQARVDRADVLLLGTPDYHGAMSSTLKNFLDHFWTEFAGKLFATVVASYEKGLTVSDQLRTVARQCYAWSLPYAVSFADGVDVKEDRIISDAFAQRLEMMTHDLQNYGALLAGQRRADLEGKEPTFLARYRKKSAPGA